MDIPQVSFTSGEVSPSLYGRIDYNRYYTGLKKCRNFIVRPMGGVANRPPFLAEVDADATAVRIISFQATSSLGYVLEFSPGLIRVIKHTTGVVDTIDTTASGITYAADDIPDIKHVQNNDVMTLTHPDYPIMQVKRYGETDWRYEAFENTDGPFQDINIDTSLTIYSSAAIGNVTLTASGNIFTSDNVGQLLYIEQSVSSTAKKWEVQKAIVLGDIRRAGANYYKALSSSTTGTVRPTVTEGTENDGDPGVVWEYLHSGSGIIRITSVTSATEAVGEVLTRLPDSLVYDPTLTKTITNVTKGANYIQYTVASHGYSTGDYVDIAGVGGITQANGSFSITTVDANNFKVLNLKGTGTYTGGGTVAKSLDMARSYKWAFEAWKGDQGYPSVSTYYQQRQIFAGSSTAQNTLWMSQTAGYTSFKQNLPLLDDDAITFTAATRERSEIRHLVELSELVMLTSTGEFVIKGSQDGVLTPGSINIKRQGYSGSSHIIPLVIDSYALFIQDKGSQIRSLGYSLAEDSFIGKDMTIISNHLFLGHTIVDWTYQKIPFSCVWAVRDDGILLCLTYMPEHEVIGWSWHDTPDGLFKSVCAVSENGQDILYALVERSGTLYVERMLPRYPASTTAADWLDRGTIAYTQEIETLEINAPSSNIRDKNKLVHHVTVLCEEYESLKVGPDSTRLTPTASIAQSTTGTVDVRIQTSWNKGGGVVIRNNANAACTILGVIPEVTVGGS